MNDEYTHERTTISAALDQTCSELEGAITTNWIVVAERMTPDGERWLTQFSGDASDDCPPIWHRRGLLTHAITMLDEPDDAADA
jgi:hypothetical protein